MSYIEECRNCRFYYNASCRRHPPQLEYNLSSSSGYTQSIPTHTVYTLIARWVYPPTGTRDWCGDYEPSPTAGA